MVNSGPPLPQPDPDTEEYWGAARGHELVIRCCLACGMLIHEPKSFCPGCLSKELEWRRVNGKGTDYSFIVVHHPVVPGFETELPYVVAAVQLVEDKSVRILTNIVDCPPTEVYIDMPVEVVFCDLPESITLPKFRPARNTSLEGGL